MDGEIVLSLERLRTLGEVDVVGESLVVQAGATTESVHRHCAAEGLTWPIDLASKGSCQIGGNIATNAGGVRVIRYGHTRHWVRGISAVLADGTLLGPTRRLAKDNCGVDLTQLLIGSEGTLAVITEACLRLARRTAREHVLLVGLDGVSAALELLREARKGPFVISAFECFSSLCVEYVMERHRVGLPLGEACAFYALLATDGRLEELEPWLEELLTRSFVRAATLSQDASQARRLWLYREAISESLGALSFPHKNDIAVPVDQLGAFHGALEQLFRARRGDWQLCVFGHAGDGNLHINALKPKDMAVEDFLTRTREADAELFELVRRFGGSISAEHGIGLVKKAYLQYARTPSEIDTLRRLKAALDPKGVLNPGKVLT